MSATKPSTSSSNTGGVKGKKEREDADSFLGPEKLPSVTYDPPPASWFFGRGGNGDNNRAGEQLSPVKHANEEDFISEDKANFSNVSRDLNRPVGNPEFRMDPGMVSDNEEDESEGFNFVAISNSLLMAGRSFEEVSRNHSSSHDNDGYSGVDNAQQGGVLIVDGIGSESGEDSIQAPIVGSTNTSHNTDASVLTIPGSDSLPSDIGTICHHDEIDEDEDHLDPLFEGGDEARGDGSFQQGNQDQGNTLKDPYFKNYPPLVHRFLKNLKQRRRLRLVSDASDENGGIPSSGVSIGRNDDDISMAWTVDGSDARFRGGPRKILLRYRFLPLIMATICLAATFAIRSFVVSQRMQREAWEQRLQQEKEAMARLLAEKESLRNEVELLLEEAAVATARADSLAKEQERLIIEREEAERAEKERIRLIQEQEQRERQKRKRRREQPWRSNSNDDDESFDWFFDESKEECRGRKNEGATFTVADNCWFKAKADFNLGSCGGDTKDFFTDLWNGLWEDWDYYFDEPARKDSIEPYSASNGDDLNKETENNGKPIHNDYHRISNGDEQQHRERGYDSQGPHYQFQDDTYYPPQDPLQDLFSAIHSAGQSFVNKLSNLMNDEVESTQNAAQRYFEVSQTVADAMDVAKEDMRYMSKEVLLALRTAAQKRNDKNYQETGRAGSHSAEPANPERPSPPTQSVTPQGLLDAASAVTSLSKSWQLYTKSLSTTGDGSE